MSGLDERLALAKALGKAAEAVEDECKRAVVERWRADGVKSRDCMVGGRKVGALSIKPCDGPRVVDAAAFDAWCAGALRDSMLDEWDEIATGVLTPGELAELHEAAERIHPGCVVHRATLAPEARRAFMGKLREAPGAAVVTPQGEVVPGLEWRAGQTVSVALAGRPEAGETKEQAQARTVFQAARLAYGVDVPGLLAGTLPAAMEEEGGGR